MVTRIDWGSMRGEVDRFEQYLREVKQASENTVQSYRRDLMQMIACCRKLDTLEKALSGSLYQKLRVIRDLTDAMRSRCIGLIPFVDHARIKAYDVALLDDAVCTWDSVYDLLVDRYAD